MIKQNFIIDELEKKRILNLHETRTKNHYLIKEQAGDATKKESYPQCVQGFGGPTKIKMSKFTVDAIAGNATTKSYNWTGYYFFSNYRVQYPDGKMGDYFCKGKEPVLGTKQVATKGGKTTSSGLGGVVLKIGSSGDAVKQVQNRVVYGKHGDGQTVGGNANCGKDINSCDGKYGRGTYDAVKKFQTSAGVTSDGVVGDETWQQLFGGVAPEQPKEVKPVGSTGSDISTNPNNPALGGGMYSDIRLKESIKLVGKSKKGINIYSFKYKNEEGYYEGVMAQELMGTKYENAVIKTKDYLMVNYEKIDVKFKKI
jgi:peptidoglycan hydrolase-like protein with peptidoglycan-binding domain